MHGRQDGGQRGGLVTLTLIPDAEALLGTLIREHPDVVAIGANASGIVPSTTAKPWVRVTQLDARKVPGERPDYLVDYMVQLDCWAGTDAMDAHAGQAEASTLARTVRAVLDEAQGQTLDDEAILTYALVTNMARVPDEEFEPARERFAITASICMRPA
jgi:hypothetical protein